MLARECTLNAPSPELHTVPSHTVTYRYLPRQVFASSYEMVAETRHRHAALLQSEQAFQAALAARNEALAKLRAASQAQRQAANTLAEEAMLDASAESMGTEPMALH